MKCRGKSFRAQLGLLKVEVGGWFGWSVKGWKMVGFVVIDGLMKVDESFGMNLMVKDWFVRKRGFWGLNWYI